MEVLAIPYILFTFALLFRKKSSSFRYQETVLVPNQPSLVDMTTVVRMIRIKD